MTEIAEEIVIRNHRTRPAVAAVKKRLLLHLLNAGDVQLQQQLVVKKQRKM